MVKAGVGPMLIDWCPLPRRSVLPPPRAGGRIKVWHEDFVVEEHPLYEPTGSGEHLYLRVRKVGLSHADAMRLIARRFGVPLRAVGFAGMKDKAATTTQAISVHTCADVNAPEAVGPRLTILAATRHAAKIRRGHLAGNRFVIRVREVDSSGAAEIAARLDVLMRVGAPNYFGEQRFGYRRNNHLVGAHLLRRDWKAASDELLAPREGTPEHQDDARRRYAGGDLQGALRAWTSGYDAEHALLSRLAHGVDPRRAILGLGRHTLAFYVSAAQSAVFNRLLDDRIERGELASLREGDLAWKHDSRAVFAVTREVAADPVTRQRLDALEISPSGPMWGCDMTRAVADVDAIEVGCLHESIGVTVDDLAAAPCRAEGARRSFRARIGNASVLEGADAHGGFMQISFDLERGAYATVVLRELFALGGMGANDEGADG
jgi:tRNA pseudouridine13 synthase